MVCSDYETVAYIAFFAVGTSGLLLSTFLAVAYFKDPVLSRCPGGLVMFQLFYQAMYDFHFVTGWPFLHG
jgi:hypothetical protein